MNDITLFFKNKIKELKILIQTERKYSDGTGMEFNIEKYAMVIRKSRKRQMIEGIKLPN